MLCCATWSASVFYYEALVIEGEAITVPRFHACGHPHKRANREGRSPRNANGP